MIGVLAFLLIKPLEHVGVELHGYQWPIKFYEHKKEAYEKIKGPAVLLIGGSNLLYGVDTNKMSAQLDIPVYNFGLGASIGLEMMLKLSGSVVKPGDTVILSLENELLYTNPYTTEGRVINDLTIPALNSELSLLEKLRASWMAPWGASFTTLKDGKSERFNNIYQTTSLTATGDLKEQVIIDNSPKTPFPRNQMTGIYILNLTNASILEHFVKQMKDMNVVVHAVPAARYVKSRSPMRYYENEKTLLKMYQSMGVDYLSDVKSHSFGAQDMFDSANHINLNGRLVNTERLLDAIEPVVNLALRNVKTVDGIQKDYYQDTKKIEGVFND